MTVHNRQFKSQCAIDPRDGHLCEALELPTDKVRVTLKQKARGGISITATT